MDLPSYPLVSLTRLLQFNLFLYGVLDTPQALYDRLKPENFTPITINLDATDVIENGPGRFILPSLFGAVEKFFDNALGLNGSRISEGRYTFAQLRNEAPTIFNISDSSFTRSQAFFLDNQGGQERDNRAYNFGNTTYNLSDNTIFVVERVSGGFEYSIENLVIEPQSQGEDFDFLQRGNFFNISRRANAILQDQIDPSEVGDTFDINYINLILEDTDLSDLDFGNIEINSTQNGITVTASASIETTEEAFMSPFGFNESNDLFFYNSVTLEFFQF